MQSMCSLPFGVVISQVKLLIPLVTHSVVLAKCYKLTWKCNMFCKRLRELKVASQCDLLTYLNCIDTSTELMITQSKNKETSIHIVFARSSVWGPVSPSCSLI